MTGITGFWHKSSTSGAREAARARDDAKGVTHTVEASEQFFTQSRGGAAANANKKAKKCPRIPRTVSSNKRGKRKTYRVTQN